MEVKSQATWTAVSHIAGFMLPVGAGDKWFRRTFSLDFRQCRRGISSRQLKPDAVRMCFRLWLMRLIGRSRCSDHSTSAPGHVHVATCRLLGGCAGCLHVLSEHVIHA